MSELNIMPHTMEEDFQHFLTYSGLRNEPSDVIDKLRLAFEGAWDAPIPELPNPPEEVSNER
jgi:hypothetical protein